MNRDKVEHQLTHIVTRLWSQRDQEIQLKNDLVVQLLLLMMAWRQRDQAITSANVQMYIVEFIGLVLKNFLNYYTWCVNSCT